MIDVMNAKGNKGHGGIDKKDRQDVDSMLAAMVKFLCE